MNTSCAVSAACTSDCDVLVIGGGPAGSTAAALLAERGYRVTLLEKAHHPRFHIGESLLPANLPLLEKLGVADAVKAIGMEKWAAEFVSPWHDHKQAFQFADAMDKSMPMAFIDPVFSSGVMLAVHSAFVEADTVDTCLRHPQQAAAALKKFDRTMRVGPKAFSWCIYRVTNPTLRDMFMGPRNIFRVKEALLSVLAGDVFGKTPIQRPLLLFKGLYYAASLLNFRRTLQAWRRRKYNIRAVDETGAAVN